MTHPPLDEQLVQLRHQLKRRRKSTSKRLEKQEQRLAAARNWKQTQHEADLLQNNFHLLRRGLTEITLPDWLEEEGSHAIKLDPSLQPKEQIAQRYKRARKEKRSIPHLEEEVIQLQSALAHWEEWLERCEAIETVEEVEALRQEAGLLPPLPPGAKREPPLPYRRFCTQAGLPILVGRTARENDELTFKTAKGSDWWLHARDAAGAHVVLQVKKGQEPDQESLLDALQVALHYSRARSAGSAEITVSQVKFVQKPRGAKAGLVLVSKHKSLYAIADPERLQRLKQR